MDEQTFHQEKANQLKALILLTEESADRNTLKMILAKHQNRLDELRCNVE